MRRSGETRYGGPNLKKGGPKRARPFQFQSRDR